MFAQTCTHFLWDISFNLFATRVGWTEILKFINQHATNAMKCLTSETAPAELNRQLPPPPPPVSSRGILAGESTVKAWRSGRFMYWHGGTGRHAQAMTVRRFTGPARHTQKHVTVFGGGGADYLAQGRQSNHSRFLFQIGYGSVAMRVLLIFMTGGGWFATHLDYVDKNTYIITIKNCVNITTIFLNRR
jgi:hypothetical protein